MHKSMHPPLSSFRQYQQNCAHLGFVVSMNVAGHPQRSTTHTCTTTTAAPATDTTISTQCTGFRQMQKLCWAAVLTDYSAYSSDWQLSQHTSRHTSPHSRPPTPHNTRAHTTAAPPPHTHTHIHPPPTCRSSSCLHPVSLHVPPPTHTHTTHTHTLPPSANPPPPLKPTDTPPAPLSPLPPAGRRPVCIQSRFICPIRRMAVLITSLTYTGHRRQGVCVLVVVGVWSVVCVGGGGGHDGEIARDTEESRCADYPTQKTHGGRGEVGEGAGVARAQWHGMGPRDKGAKCM